MPELPCPDCGYCPKHQVTWCGSGGCYVCEAPKTYPLAETPRLKVAYLLWQVHQGYISRHDRAITYNNWLLGDPAKMHPNDAAELPGWLDLADIVLAAVAEIQQ